MSVHSVLTSDEVLLQDIRLALLLDDTDAVYAGRYARPVRRPVEVWVETAATRPLSGLTRADQHPYRIHIRTDLSNLGADQAATGALETIKGHMQTLRDRFDGIINTDDTDFLDRLPGLISITAEEETVDEDINDAGVLDGVVFLALIVRR